MYQKWALTSDIMLQAPKFGCKGGLGSCFLGKFVIMSLKRALFLHSFLDLDFEGKKVVPAKCGLPIMGVIPPGTACVGLVANSMNVSVWDIVALWQS